MKFETRGLNPNDIPMLLDYEMNRLAAEESDPVERELQSWHARWRKESLEHYLPLGWSFGLFSQQGALEGYFLAQPLLFFRGMTQNLWVEHLGFNTEKVAIELIELAYKWSRDKHLQKVLIYCDSVADSQAESVLASVKETKAAKLIDDHIWEIPTAKIRV